MIKPTELEAVALDIVTYWEKSKAAADDKIKILEMIRDFYLDRNEHVLDQYLAELATRTIDKHAPRTGFEKDE